MSQTVQQLMNTRSLRTLSIHEVMKPVKDLALLWNINIEGQIDEFITEFMESQDFREAAVLIENSMVLFAKKVDTLFDMMTQVLTMQSTKKRRQSQKSSDLQLDLDVEAVGFDISNFFQQIENSKRANNLFLIPKQPYTMLQTRRIVENNDPRITPVYNSIYQSDTLIFEQWDDGNLNEVLVTNNIAAQPMLYSTPLHPHFLEIQSSHLSATMRRSGVFFQLQSPNLNHLNLQEEQVKLEQQNEEEPQQLIPGDMLNPEAFDNNDNNFQLMNDDYLPANDDINIADLQPMRINKLQNYQQFIEQIDQSNDFEQQLSLANIFTDSQFKRFVTKFSYDDDIEDNIKPQGFQRFKLVKEAKQPQNEIPNISIIQTEQQLNDLGDNLFLTAFSTIEDILANRKTQTVICRQIQVGMEKHVHTQDMLDTTTMVENQININREQNQNIQLNQLDVNIAPIRQVDIPKESVRQEKHLKDAPQQNRQRRNNQDQQSLVNQYANYKRPFQQLFVNKYVDWVTNLQKQLAKQTPFNIEGVKNHVLRKRETSLSELVSSYNVEMKEEETEKVKKARCFISSLFLATEGKVRFEQSSGDLIVKIVDAQ